MIGTYPIKFFIADDIKELCESVEMNIKNLASYYKIDSQDIVIHKVFTDHAYDHGCDAVSNGFIPDICIFDLVFNGYTGLDLYKYIVTETTIKPYVCIYTGVESTYSKRKDAQMLCSESNGLAEIIQKPNIEAVLLWISRIFEKEYKLVRTINSKDPFDML